MGVDGESLAILHEMHLVDMWVDVREHRLNVTPAVDHMALINDPVLVLDFVSGPLTRGDRVVSYTGVGDLP